METFFTSDLHFGHTNIIEYCNRPFDSVEDMNQSLISNWNSVVTNDDVVFIVGDFAMGKIAETLPLAKLLNGKKCLVPGNHDRCWTGHKKQVERFRKEYSDVGFQILDNEIEMRFADTFFRICHFPYAGDSHDEDRYVNHRPIDQGSYLLHGHIHDMWKINGRQINVGTDVWDYRPVNIYEILDNLGVK